MVNNMNLHQKPLAFAWILSIDQGGSIRSSIRTHTLNKTQISASTLSPLRRRQYPQDLPHHRTPHHMHTMPTRILLRQLLKHAHNIPHPPPVIIPQQPRQILEPYTHGPPATPAEPAAGITRILRRRVGIIEGGLARLDWRIDAEEWYACIYGAESVKRVRPNVGRRVGLLCGAGVFVNMSTWRRLL